jgi:D-alanine-D-alanine ligase
MTHRLAPCPPLLDETCAGRVRDAQVVVLAGGASGEREVSLLSGAEIARALGQSDGRGPARVRLVELDADGNWSVGGERCPAPEALRRLGRVDAFLLALHGGAGENGTLQGFLESAGARYTGSGVAASTRASAWPAARASRAPTCSPTRPRPRARRGPSASAAGS